LEKKKAASQIETLPPEQSEHAEREDRATTWLETFGGKNHGRIYGTCDMASHFSYEVFEGFYGSQLPSSSSIG
jgi:hypothetical protein